MEKNKQLEEVKKLLEERKLSQALDALQTYLYAYPQPANMDKLEAISEQIAFFKERSLKKAYTRAIAYYYSTVRSFMKQAKKNHYEQEVIELKKLNKLHLLRYGFHLLKYRLHKE